MLELLNYMWKFSWNYLIKMWGPPFFEQQQQQKKNPVCYSLLKESISMAWNNEDNRSCPNDILLKFPPGPL